MTDMSLARLVEALAKHFPSIIRVYMMRGNGFETPLFTPQPDPTPVHRSLKELDVGFSIAAGRPFLREECQKLLMTLTATCPALEVVRLGALFLVDGGGIDERCVAPDRVMDMRRSVGGEWKERTWGGVVTPS